MEDDIKSLTLSNINNSTLSSIYTSNNNILGMLQRLEVIMDSNGYKELYARYLELSKDIPKDEVLTEAEKVSCSFGTDIRYYELDRDIRDFEKELTYYNEYKELSDLLNEIKEDSMQLFKEEAKVDDFINKNKRFVELLINIKNDKCIQQFTNLLNTSIDTLFYSLMQLSVIRNNELLEFVNQVKSDYLTEHIASRVRNLIDTTMYKGKLEDDYLNINTLYACACKDESIIAQQREIEEYKKRKIALEEERKELISLLQEQIKALDIEMKECKDNLNKLKVARKIIYLKKLLFKLLVASAIAIPLISPFVGHSIGKNASSKVLLTKTITKTVDVDTGEIISESDSYEELTTNYVASVTICDPWKKNISGISYSRNCTVYDYIIPDNVSDDFRLTMDNLEPDNLVKKYTYEEPTSTVSNPKYLTESQLYITETYQDLNDVEVSTKYNLPYTLVGLGVGGVIASTEAIVYFKVVKEKSDELRSKLTGVLSENKKEIESTTSTLKLVLKRRDKYKQKHKDLVDNKEDV